LGRLVSLLDSSFLRKKERKKRELALKETRLVDTHLSDLGSAKRKRIRAQVLGEFGLGFVTSNESNALVFTLFIYSSIHVLYLDV